MGAFLETLLGNMYGWVDFFYCRNLEVYFLEKLLFGKVK